MPDFPDLWCQCGNKLTPGQVSQSGRRICGCLRSWEPSEDHKHIAPPLKYPSPAPEWVSPSPTPTPAAPSVPTASQKAPLPAKSRPPKGAPPTRNTTPGASGAPMPVSGVLLVDSPDELIPAIVLPKNPPTVPLVLAQDELLTLIVKGTHCRLCGQPVKIYSRPLNSAMSRTLIKMHLHGKKTDGWVNMSEVKNFGLPSRDYGTLAHWGMTEKGGGVKSDGNPRTGLYRITKKGLDFIEDRIRVPAAIWTYNKKLLGMSKETISVREALGKKFNYTEMMNG